MYMKVHTDSINKSIYETSQKTLKYVFWNLYPRYERSIKKVYIIITKGLLRWQPFHVIYYSHFHSNPPMSMGYQYIVDKDYNIQQHISFYNRLEIMEYSFLLVCGHSTKLYLHEG